MPDTTPLQWGRRPSPPAAPTPRNHPDRHAAWLRLVVGDAAAALATVPDGSVDLVFTSPPFWGLRDYHSPGQYGHEANLDDYLAHLRAVFAQLARVLAGDGTVWLHLGDSYGGSWGNYHAGQPSPASRQVRMPHYGTHRPPASRYRPKCLLGVPWRVCLDLIDDGWILRNHIIWHRPNSTPTSATDRLHNRHDALFLLTRSPHYRFDRAALRAEAGPAGAGDVWTLPSRPRTQRHPTGGYADLARRAVLAGTHPGQLVCDPFSGSGTTGYAALTTGRRYLGIDLEPAYHQQLLDTLNPTGQAHE
ncbi:DNA-methyltransferase [Actinocatenispora comari]|uniref:Methyltransferase n=1 Tax=Actinocatenispora comari TaxID=2807577 RepID=A0A8J4AEG6_9ACTN|nr:site-specific DNA-methyltransferase [Actinocatenispora comari]GIL29089.1 methyltransferase [Actinocatenispora comari]